MIRLERNLQCCRTQRDDDQFWRAAISALPELGACSVASAWHAFFLYFMLRTLVQLSSYGLDAYVAIFGLGNHL